VSRSRGGIEGDTEDMNRERAETYLRALAETELRRATSQPSGNAQRADHAARVERVAQVLAFVGALDAGLADQILGDFELALGARQTGRTGSVAGWFPRRAALGGKVSVLPAAAGGSAAGRSGAGPTAGRAHAPVPLGQIVRVRGADARGEVCLLSYARVAGPPRASSCPLPVRPGRQLPPMRRSARRHPAPASTCWARSRSGCWRPCRPSHTTLAVRDRATARGAPRRRRRTR
jgi:hypothetical protein